MRPMRSMQHDLEDDKKAGYERVEVVCELALGAAINHVRCASRFRAPSNPAKSSYFKVV